jgi:hypothetical protein
VLAERARLEGTVDVVDAEIIDVAVRTAAESLGLPPETSAAERRARGLVAVARHFLDHASDPAASGVGRPHVLVMVDLEVLDARTGGTATLAAGTVIRGDQARRLAMDANVSAWSPAAAASRSTSAARHAGSRRPSPGR